MIPTGADCLSVADTARLLGVSKPTVYRLARAGHIPHTRVASLVRFRRAAIEAYLAARTTTAWLPGERTNRGPDELRAAAATKP